MTSTRSKEQLYTIGLSLTGSRESIGLTLLRSIQDELHYTPGAFDPHSSQGSSAQLQLDFEDMLTSLQVASPSVSHDVAVSLALNHHHSIPNTPSECLL